MPVVEAPPPPKVMRLNYMLHSAFLPNHEICPKSRYHLAPLPSEMMGVTIEKICHYAKQQQQQQQHPPPPPRRDFQLSFHRFLKREPKEDPKAAGACVLEGGRVKKRRVARRAVQRKASFGEDIIESEEGVAAVMRRARRGMAELQWRWRGVRGLGVQF
eukprot:1159167-Pelagomonas_calceolata.AAC.9